MVVATVKALGAGPGSPAKAASAHSCYAISPAQTCLLTSSCRNEALTHLLQAQCTRIVLSPCSPRDGLSALSLEAIQSLVRRPVEF